MAELKTDILNALTQVTETRCWRAAAGIGKTTLYRKLKEYSSK